MKFDLAVVGHIVLDHIVQKGRVQRLQLGGPCIYASLASKALDAKPVVVSKVGHDFGSKRLSWIRTQGICASRILIEGSATTRFRINYHDGDRSMQVTSVCVSIKNEDSPKLPAASAVHIGPVLNEVSPVLAARLSGGNSLVGLDPQGYLRGLDSNGIVHLRKWRNSRLLKKIEVLKVSQNELAAMVGGKAIGRKLSSLGPKIVLLTRGPMGSIVWSKYRGTFSVPAYEIPVRDPTGAGDALAGAFLVTWARTRDLLWSAAVATAAASFPIARSSFADFGNRKQIEGRAMKILDQTKRM